MGGSVNCSAFAKCPCRLRVPPTDHPRPFMASWYGKEIGPRFSRAHRASTAPPGLRSVVRSFVLNVTSHSLTFFIFVFRFDERPTALGCRAHFCLAQHASTTFQGLRKGHTEQRIVPLSLHDTKYARQIGDAVRLANDPIKPGITTLN